MKIIFALILMLFMTCSVLPAVIGVHHQSFQETLKFVALFIGPGVTVLTLVATYWLTEQSKRKERALAFKKECYAALYADLVKFQMHLLKLPALLGKPDSLDVTVLSEFAANTAKVELVAPIEVIKKIHQVGVKIREMYPQLRDREASKPFTEYRIEALRAATQLRHEIVDLAILMRKELELEPNQAEFAKLLRKDIDHANARAYEIIQGTKWWQGPLAPQLETSVSSDRSTWTW